MDALCLAGLQITVSSKTACRDAARARFADTLSAQGLSASEARFCVVWLSISTVMCNAVYNTMLQGTVHRTLHHADQFFLHTFVVYLIAY